MRNNCLVLLGALAGGLVGYFAFFWLVHQGFYGLILPGGILALGAGTFRGHSLAMTIVCGLLAIALGLFTEWRFAPFIQDNGFGYFLLHIHQLKSVTLIMIAVGGVLGFWLPFRRMQESTRGQQ